jgi:spoIIIJ-associated protein
VKALEVSAKTVDEAVSIAVLKLGADKERLEIEILEQPVKGLFGMIGAKDAKIRASVKLNASDKANDFLVKLLGFMGVSASVQVSEEDETVSAKIEGNQVGMLIGHRGETLDAIQYLTGIVANRDEQNHKRVTVDTQDYRIKREKTLINLAERLAKNVYKTKKDISLEPMNPYERRIIHATLQDNQYVRTYSKGDEPYRRVVLTLKEKRSNSSKL